MIISGHRGARGEYPENTLRAFIELAKSNITSIELDVVVCKSGELVVSHEPWFNYKFSSSTDFSITKQNQISYNLYELDYSQIVKFDVGLKQNQDFPNQISYKARKPLLREVLDELMQLQIDELFIEVKSEENWYGRFQPYPENYATIVINELNGFVSSSDKIIVKSFDYRFMNEFSKKEFHGRRGFLVENKQALNLNLSRLDFIPDFYNPDTQLVTTELIKELDTLNIDHAVWTVNGEEDYYKLKEMGVRRIITDYPQKFLSMIS